MKDPILEEVRKFREEHAKKFNYDLDKICEDLIAKQKASKRPTVNLRNKINTKKQINQQNK